MDRQVIPGIIHGIAGRAARHPFLVDVVPNIPFITARNSAFMSPDERLTIHELVDIKFKRLGDARILHIEIYFVGEAVKIGKDRLAGIGQVLGGNARLGTTQGALYPSHEMLRCMVTRVTVQAVPGPWP